MILYFTGCGNSGEVAMKLAERLGERTVVRLTTEQMQIPTLDAHDGRFIVWVMPVYSWGLPPVVADYMKRVEITTTRRHYLVLTCGDDAGLADKQWRKIVESRCWMAATAHTVIMPNTYTLMKGFDVDSPAVEKQKLDAVDSRCDQVAAAILDSNNVGYVKRGGFPWFKSRVIYPWFRRYAMSPKPFHHTDACISCGACSRTCPMDNIAMVDGHPAWGADCALCLGCYHVCPVHAVAYGKATDGKGQYLNPVFFKRK